MATNRENGDITAARACSASCAWLISKSVNPEPAKCFCTTSSDCDGTQACSYRNTSARGVYAYAGI